MGLNENLETRDKSGEFGSGSNSAKETTQLTASCIIVYLALFPVWADLTRTQYSFLPAWADWVRIHYSFAVFRLLFVVGVCAVLWRQGNARAIPPHLFGRLPSRWADLL